MKKTILKAQPRRVVGRRVKQLRRTGTIPANVFGRDIQSVNLQMNHKDVVSLLKRAGESSLAYLQIEGEADERPVMAAEVRRDPVTGDILHVGWHQVDLKQKVTTAIPVKLVGEAPAEQQHLGILVRQLAEIEVEALPTDMPEGFEVDISGLAAVDDAVYIRDIKLDSQLTLKSDPEAIVVKIEPLAKGEAEEAKVEEPKVEAEKTEAPAPAN